jgi:hypothetical protein
MKRLILFGELFCVYDTLSERLRLNKLLDTTSMLLKNKMSLEEIWLFYQRRRDYYKLIGNIILFLFGCMIYYSVTNEKINLYIMIPYIVISFFCVQTLIKPERKYRSVWDNREEFVSLIRFNNVDQYMSDKNNFWNVNKSNNTERILTLTNKYKFNVFVVKQFTSLSDDSLPTVTEALPSYGGVDFGSFSMFAKSHIDGTIHEFTLDDLKRFFNPVENEIQPRYLNQSLSYSARIKNLCDFKNNFNNIELNDVVAFFQPLRKFGKCHSALKCFDLSDDEFIEFIVVNFIDNTSDDTKFLKLTYKKGSKGKLLTLFHQFFIYSVDKLSLQKRGSLDYYKKLYLRTFDGLEDLKDSNFSSTDTEYQQLLKLYRNQNNLIS